MEPIFATFWTTVLEHFWGPFWRQNRLQKGTKNGTTFGTALPPHLRGLALTFSGIIREVWKGYWNWNYTLQRRGKDNIPMVIFLTRQLSSLIADPFREFPGARGRTRRKARRTRRQLGGAPLAFLHCTGPPGLPSSSSLKPLRGAPPMDLC